MNNVKISTILVLLSFIFGITSFASTTYGGNNKQTNTWSVTVQKSEEDWKENSKEPIRQIKENLPKPIWKIIPKASASEKEPLQNTVTVKNVEKNIRTPFEIYEQVKHLGYREEPTVSIISTCKTSSSDIQKCILFGLIIMYNESGNKQNSNSCINKNNCLWVKSWKISYSSLDEWMENWVQIFNRYWYKAESPSFFYSEKWKLSKSRYCVSESSSDTAIGCPNWLSIANKKYEQLYPIIYLN